MNPDLEAVYNARSEQMFAEFGLIEPVIEPMYREKRIGEDEMPPFTRFDGFAFAAMKWHFAKRKEKIDD